MGQDNESLSLRPMQYHVSDSHELVFWDLMVKLSKSSRTT